MTRSGRQPVTQVTQDASAQKLRLQVPRSVLVREFALAVLPALLTITLLTVATLPAYRTLMVNGGGWAPYAYQGLVQDVQAYQVARFDPHMSAAERRDIRDRALSSTQNPAQFAGLSQIEAMGEARLGQVDRLLRQDTNAAVAQSVREAVELSAQAGNYANNASLQNIRTLNFMRTALLGTALLTGLLSMLLITRALWLWRQERERRARREARQREALSLASHELRRPLQQLLLASDLLRQAETPEMRQSLLAQIEDSAAQIANRADLTRLNDLYLDVTLRVSKSDLVPLLKQFAGKRVRVQLPQGPLVWPVDASRLRQIIENLLENALKYTGGPVEITLSLVAGQPDIQVRDYGPGLSEELRHKVFLPYERGPQGLGQGQGLGLSLVRRYARAHGGDVTLETPPDGEGTLAHVRLGLPVMVDGQE